MRSYESFLNLWSVINMRVYFDVFSGDEMLSDSYPMTLIYDEAAFEVPSRMITKGSVQVDIGRGNQFGGGGEDEEVADDNEEKVNDILSAFTLNEVGFSKKEYANYIKTYMQRLKTYLQENKPDRVAPFMAGAQGLIKWVLANFTEFTFYTGESYDQTAMIVLSYFKQEADETPHFILIRDGLREEKF